MSSPIRITGMASGLDVDSLVKQMMNAEKVKVDKLSQDRQVVKWKQDIYRDILGDLNTFKSSYFDVLKPDSYMISTKNYSSFDVTSIIKATGATTSAVTATAGPNALSGTYTVNVQNLASSAMVTGTALNVLEASKGLNFPSTIIKNSNDKLKFSIGTPSTTFNITLDAKTYTSLSELAGNINSKLSSTLEGNNISEKLKAVVSSDGKTINLATMMKIDDSNKTLDLNVTSAGTTTTYSVTLDSGNYTLDELKTQIESKLKAASVKGSTSLPTVDLIATNKVTINNDGSSIAFGTGTGATALTTNHDTNYKVEALVTSAGNTGGTAIGYSITGNENISSLNYGQTITQGINSVLTVNLDGKSYDLDLAKDGIIPPYTNTNSTDTLADIVNKIKVKLTAEPDKNDINNIKKLSDSLVVRVSLDGTKIEFVSKTNSSINLSGNLMSTIGLASNVNLNQTTSGKMSSLFDDTNTDNGKVHFNINGVNFNYDFKSDTDKDKTMSQVLEEISVKANVKITYSELSRKFTLASSSTGAAQTVSAFNTGSFDTTKNKFIDTLFGVSSVNTADNALPAKFDFTLSEANFSEGQTITIGTKTYTAKAVPSTDDEFNIGSDIKATAASLAAKISGDYTAVSDINGKITLTQTTASSNAAPTITQSGTDVTISQVATSSPYLPGISTDTGSSIIKGKDAVVTIKEPNNQNGIEIRKATNSFTLDGVNYNLNQAGLGDINLTLTANFQKSVDKIKTFVDKYNEIIDKINTKLYEKKQYEYKPLSEDQKKDMNDDEIKAWEEKAKQGLLSNDSTLSSMLSSIRSAFYEPVKGNYADSSNIGISMSDIGVTTSSDISQRGKLIIDETKLKDALQNKGDKVIQLFTKTSTTVPSYSASSSTTDRNNRYKELGVFQRVSDILQDNLRTIRDNNGRKGILLEKAGIKGDYSEYHNLLTDDLVNRDKVIKNMTSKLADKENAYYTKFSKLESAMQKLNSQSNWLASQLGNTNG